MKMPISQEALIASANGFRFSPRPAEAHRAIAMQLLEARALLQRMHEAQSREQSVADFYVESAMLSREAEAFLKESQDAPLSVANSTARTHSV